MGAEANWLSEGVLGAPVGMPPQGPCSIILRACVASPQRHLLMAPDSTPSPPIPPAPWEPLDHTPHVARRLPLQPRPNARPSPALDPTSTSSPLWHSANGPYSLTLMNRSTPRPTGAPRCHAPFSVVGCQMQPLSSGLADITRRALQPRAPGPATEAEAPRVSAAFISHPLPGRAFPTGLK